MARELLTAIDNLKARLFGCTDANEAAELRQAIGERTQQVHMLRRARRLRASAATGLDAAGG